MNDLINDTMMTTYDYEDKFRETRWMIYSRIPLKV